MSVEHSLVRCKEFHCQRCGHSHLQPFPQIKMDNVLIKVKTWEKDYVNVENHTCQTTSVSWMPAYGDYGNYNTIFFCYNI